MQTKLESAVIPTLLLIVDNRQYTVEFPLPAIVQAEEKTGLSLKSLQNWFDIPAKHLPEVLCAGLAKHHPNVTEGEIQVICSQLNPESLAEVHYALCKLAFPKTCARIEEARVKGNTNPNAPSGDAR